LLPKARNSRPSELGSLAPLGIGLALISLSAVLLTLSAGSLYLTQRRLTAVAESTALAVLADSNGNLGQRLEPLAKDYLSTLDLRGLNQVDLVEASASDTLTVNIKLCSVWKPIFPSYMFSETGRVCSEALARRGR
jgi:hypothetical protein